jgi:hypothetical protein
MPEDANAPVTKADLAAAVAEIKEATAATVAEAIQASESRMQEFTREAIQAAEDRRQEFTRGVETDLLKAFHGYATGQGSRLNAFEATTTAS